MARDSANPDRDGSSGGQHGHSEPSTVDGTRRSATDPTLTSSASHESLPNPQRSRAANTHVRFSLDTERVPLNTTSLDDGSLSPIVQTPVLGPSRPAAQRPGTPTLSLDIDKANKGSVLGQAVQQSPTSLKSPDSPKSAIPKSPGRARGYSLRRSLFNKNVQTQIGAGGSIIELQEAGPSDSRGLISSSPDAIRSEGKKSTDTQVFVSAAEAEDGVLPSMPPEKKREMGRLQGISALPHYEDWLREHAAKNTLVVSLRSGYKKARNFILRINEIPPSKDGRQLDLDASRREALIDERTQRAYIPNTIRSSRYNVWNFVPRQLFAQFSKLANFYFLVISILQMIPGLSTTGTYTTIIPLLFFVCISIAKEGYDDLRRYRLDQEENNRETPVLNAYQASEDDQPSSPKFGLKRWAATKWRDIQVGDVIKLERDQPVPADVILLHSSGENGIAYIETMALDGETNLKSKSAAPSLAKACKTLDDLAEAKAHFVVEDPNLDLYNFEGKVTVDKETAPLTLSEVVYRGSIMRNTSEAYGLVIYSGEECKIRMNANKNPRTKAPMLQALVNKIVVLIVIFVLALAVGNSVAYEIWQDFEDVAWYLNKATVEFGPIIVSFIIMFNTMIPLSLYVSLEIVKVCQRFLLNDIDMYDEVSNTPMEARTSTINEELGQISYVFSDKTGTLTDNSMKFRKLSVAGTAWLHDNDLQEEAAREQYKQRLIHKKRNKGKKPARKASAHEVEEQPRTSTGSALLSPLSPQLEDGAERSPTRWKSSARPSKSQPELHTREMLLYIQRKPYTVFARKARFFLLSIALCHTCLPEKKEDGTINFQAASPDELALVQAAQELGYIAIDRASSTLQIRTYPDGADAQPKVDHYEVLDVIEFSSKRKRMSVVVRFPDGRVCVVSKGADSIMMQLLRLSSLAIQKTVEIEKRASKRKSMEAQQAIARKSEAREARKSMGRVSMSLAGPSGRKSIGRKSSSGGRPLRDHVDSWLTKREQDVDTSILDDDTAYQTPRPSTNNIGRVSMAPSEARSSIQDADFDLVDEAMVVDESAVVERCAQHINDFATEGLRTLLYGYRFLDQQEYLAWQKVYHDATTSLVDRQLMIERAGDLIERDFELAGATAIEDKLQKGVPECIDKLRRANIKMWMLTGDKRETAINIGHSCRLIKDYSSVTVLDHEQGQVEQNIAGLLVAINGGEIAHSVVVVDGATLALIEADPYMKSLFLELAIVTDSVICCRASPSQKAGLVKAIRHKVKDSVTLAIGDGANDIAMIQEAHVGIGITGKEGLQAARTSDYSIAQFRFLAKLLLVHGRWNYVRTCKYTVATFWKEFMFYLSQALYQRSAGYTGTSLYESWSLSMFNTLFTSLAVIILGIFEKDLQASTLLAVPELYSKGQRNGGFNIRIYAFWMVLATCEALVVFFTAQHLWGYTNTTFNDLFPLGQLCFSSMIVFINTKVLFIEMHNRSYPSLIAWFLSVGGWWLWNIVLASIYGNNAIYDVKEGFLERFGHNLQWWACLFAIIISLFAVEIGVKTLKAGIRPSETDIFQALEQDLPTRKRFEEASAMELQAGWVSRGRDKKTSAEIQAEEAEEIRREAEVLELLQNRTNSFDSRRPRSGPKDIGTREREVRYRDDEDDEDISSEGSSQARGPHRQQSVGALFKSRFGSVKLGTL